MSHPSTSDDNTWIQIAEAMGIEAEIIAGRLRVNDIPVFVESRSGLNFMFGQAGDVFLIYVPHKYYGVACDILDDDDDIPALDGPSIQL